MVTLGKLLIGLITTLSVNSMLTYELTVANNQQTELYDSRYISRYPKEKVLQILDNKCNVCHHKRNKKRVFTPENMDAWANDIYTQVFVKKRMPKGKKIKLNSTEYQELLTWISSTKTSTNGI
jgi:uncharacterized membrane protein